MWQYFDCFNRIYLAQDFTKFGGGNFIKSQLILTSLPNVTASYFWVLSIYEYEATVACVYGIIILCESSHYAHHVPTSTQINCIIVSKRK